MGNSNFLYFCNDNTTDNTNQTNLRAYINYPNNIYFCCPNNSNKEGLQEDLSNKNNFINNGIRNKKFIEINNKENKNNLIDNEENNNDYNNLVYLQNSNKNNNQNDYYNNNQENLQNIDNSFNNKDNYNYYNQENVSNKNNNNLKIDNKNIEGKNNNINNDNRFNINESILSFRDKIFPKIPEINGTFTYIIPPGTKGPFVRNVSENITFIDEGQFIQVEMDIVIINLPQNQCSISYGVSFESQIYDVHCNLENNYEYDSHHIKFYYNLKNNESIHISFDYKKYNQNICEYYRSEFILIGQIFHGGCWDI